MERLEADGHAEEFRLRHAHWHLALAEEIASAETVEGNYDRLEREHDNFRAALAAFRRTMPIFDSPLSTTLDEDREDRV